MLETNFRSAHEPERAELLYRVVSFDEQKIRRDELDDYLRERGKGLELDFDSSWANYFVMDRLVVLFPDTKFIQLVRDCFSWVESITNHLISRTIPRDVEDFMEWWFQPGKYRYTKEDRTLEQLGLYPLESYLTRWKRHAEGPARSVPGDRLLLVRTHEIPESLGRIARFLGVPPELVDAAKSHRNRGAREKPLFELIDKGYLEDTVARVCRGPMELYFPDVKGVDDALASWRERAH